MRSSVAESSLQPEADRLARLAERRPIGDDPAFAEVLLALQRLGEWGMPTLIEGETGTGKEVLAAWVHECSERWQGPLVVVHCAALPAELFESEMFGHAKGAYTGAVGARRGLWRAAEGGTLVLDDVAELPLVCQAKLLRPLQTGDVRPIGADRETRTDVRIVATSNRSLATMVDRATFRSDLYYRLRAGLVTVPPLRQRLGDVAALAVHFAGREGITLTPDALAKLAHYDWPGNVRELEHAISRLGALSPDGTLTAWEVERNLVPVVRAGMAEPEAGFQLERAWRDAETRLIAMALRSGDDDGRKRFQLRRALRRVEREMVDRAMRHAGGSQEAAAKLLGLKRSTLSMKLRKLREVDDGD